DDLVSGIKVLANEVLEKSNRTISQVSPFNLEDEIKKAKNIAQTYKFNNTDSQKKESNTAQSNNIEPPEKEQQTPKEEKSFFDDID
ncbi:MAG: hypothetical protein OEW67_15365, partial [Cyclobacteriaceae bacterium]|nr:hypothetical protein [Cyclobacteriaceae bacterium]